MLNPGDIVIVDFPGAIGIKTRPAIVLSTNLYHTHRPDVIVGLVTTHIAAATAPTDYVLQDWAAAGLHQPSAYRSYLVTLDDGSLPPIGHLSDRDWQEVQARLKLALAVP
ncbi:MAG: type II toxin-antitoxin system PemK/MazF family toxin [candidate division KSB1 bacterium]|nr:type II toxin-antitoxin system PemK/MazF family toxin [candidate division KSB1 bacterium]MDZ7304165.1 type II toxin-antitoxin system PemK/MazF family toxin [candidate division KSB1 bacterium]MDZ7310637.1 type II toxin-antitoxin system PemK/MazF family toxin [candidate division KSB1 bacterium]MDZ7362926.1 type II toxin-antitoxin system PemK/MazF family toxin [candidate division KSB1 bacterium]MDZ7368106.1 type II toxin-antitoxin system PemK/MazF family toxin [candidate division KSB1 bacterium